MVTVENERVVRIVGRQDHPSTHGALCTKVSRYAERTYHPERVLHRCAASAQGRGARFERVSWAPRWRTSPRGSSPSPRVTRKPSSPTAMPAPWACCRRGHGGRFFNKLEAARLDRTICAMAGGNALIEAYGGKIGMHPAISPAAS